MKNVCLTNMRHTVYSINEEQLAFLDGDGLYPCLNLLHTHKGLCVCVFDCMFAWTEHCYIQSIECMLVRDTGG